MSNTRISKHQNAWSQDGLGGENFGWTSAECYKKVGSIGIFRCSGSHQRKMVDIQWIYSGYIGKGYIVVYREISLEMIQ